MFNQNEKLAHLRMLIAGNPDESQLILAHNLFFMQSEETVKGTDSMAAPEASIKSKLSLTETIRLWFLSTFAVVIGYWRYAEWKRFQKKSESKSENNSRDL